MLNEHRRAALKRYAAKAASPQYIGKILRDPAIIGRAVKTFTSNRNLRTVPKEELLRNAESSVHALARLGLGRSRPALEDWLPIRKSDGASALGELFRQCGSDKSTEHDYFEVYGSILADKRADAIRILEIGLGTNNLAFQSNMGLGGRPGASLCAFRDWAPNSEIIGADLDRGILFDEERIRTYFVDQTDPGSLAELAAIVGTGFDLIIDDGLHLPHSNLNTIEALLPLLKADGTMVIEDIDQIHLHYWKVAQAVLCNHDTCLVERKAGWLFIIRN